jgi:hypothetical protein
MHRQLALWFVLATVCATLLGLGCGTGSWQYNMRATQRDPGADGTLRVERIEGNNRMVTVSLRFVAPPDRHGNGLTTYILWFRDARGAATMASALEYDPASRTARATATTPRTQFEAIITAERNAQVGEPSDFIVFNQRVRAE